MWIFKFTMPKTHAGVPNVLVKEALSEGYRLLFSFYMYISFACVTDIDIARPLVSYSDIL